MEEKSEIMGKENGVVEIIVDNGHGKTCTKGSPDGTYREWQWAREMARMLVTELKRRGYEASLLVPEDDDVPVNERARRVNGICRQKGAGKALLVSIHSNANSADGRWHDGEWSGFVAIVSPNASAKSKQAADFIWARAIEAGLKGNRSFTDKPGKRFLVQNLGICRDSMCPAVLTESAFHDTREGVRLLQGAKQRIMLAHADGIEDYVNWLKLGGK